MIKMKSFSLSKKSENLLKKIIVGRCWWCWIMEMEMRFWNPLWDVMSKTFFSSPYDAFIFISEIFNEINLTWYFVIFLLLFLGIWFSWRKIKPGLNRFEFADITARLTFRTGSLNQWWLKVEPLLIS